MPASVPPPGTASAAPPDPAVADRMLVEIWSDLVCPWCYLGKRRLERAFEGFEHADRVDVVWRSFEFVNGDAADSFEHAESCATVRVAFALQQALVDE